MGLIMTNNSESSLRDEVEAILHQLKQPGVHALDLLFEYWLPQYEKLWQSDIRLYRTFSRKLISTGHPARAIELIREAIQRQEFKGDPELKYLLALAFARSGNIRVAEGYVKELVDMESMTPDLRVEALSLRGRL